MVLREVPSMGFGKYLIVGGTGGIGSALTKRLMQKGYQVHLLSRHQEKLRQIAASMPASGGLESGASFSLSDMADLRNVGYNEVDVMNTPALEAAVKGAGRLRGLAYAVGSITLKPLKATTTEEFVQAYLLNTVGAATAVRAALPGLMEEYKRTGQAGSIVLFSTVAVQQGFPNHSIVSAVKGGIEGLTRALAAELAPAVRVNCVAPSLTDTPLASVLTKSNAVKEAVAKAHPIPRLGTGDDSAALASFLLDDKESSWVTGQIIGVDGGRSTIRK